MEVRNNHLSDAAVNSSVVSAICVLAADEWHAMDIRKSKNEIINLKPDDINFSTKKQELKSSIRSSWRSRIIVDAIVFAIGYIITIMINNRSVLPKKQE